MPTKLSDINNLLDSLYLELLNLIEQQTACRVNIEKTSKKCNSYISFFSFFYNNLPKNFQPMPVIYYWLKHVTIKVPKP